MQKDPDPGQLNLPATVVNAYAYVVNDPMNITDPTGESWWTDWGKKLVIGSLIGIATVATGGLAGAALVGYLGVSGFAAVAIGAAAGAVVGGLLGGGLYELTGIGTFREGFLVGAISGGIAGGFAGYAQGLRNVGYDSYSLRFDRPHHRFGLLGKQHHFQLDIWKSGVSGSGRTLFHVPAPPIIKPGQILP